MQAGFTLIETLGVLVIIALMTSAVILTWSAPKSGLQNQAETILGELNALAEHSLMTGQTSAVGLSNQSYAFYVFESGAWAQKQNQPWTSNISVELIQDESPVELGDHLVPLITFEPTGLSSVFELRLTDATHSFVFASTGDGHVRRGPS